MRFRLKTTTVCNWLILSIIPVLIELVVWVPLAWAEIRHSYLFLSSYEHQTFESLIQQAAALAKTSIEQEFSANSSVSEVSVIIASERNGQEVPLLISTVSRSDWQKSPRIYQWTHYFSSSEILLGFLKPQAPQSVLITAQTPLDDGRGFDDEDD